MRGAKRGGKKGGRPRKYPATSPRSPVINGQTCFFSEASFRRVMGPEPSFKERFLAQLARAEASGDNFKKTHQQRNKDLDAPQNEKLDTFRKVAHNWATNTSSEATLSPPGNPAVGPERDTGLSKPDPSLKKSNCDREEMICERSETAETIHEKDRTCENVQSEDGTFDVYGSVPIRGDSKEETESPMDVPEKNVDSPGGSGAGKARVQEEGGELCLVMPSLSSDEDDDDGHQNPFDSPRFVKGDNMIHSGDGPSRDIPQNVITTPGQNKDHTEYSVSSEIVPTPGAPWDTGEPSTPLKEEEIPIFAVKGESPLSGKRKRNLVWKEEDEEVGFVAKRIAEDPHTNEEGDRQHKFQMSALTRNEHKKYLKLFHQFVRPYIHCTRPPVFTQGQLEQLAAFERLHSVVVEEQSKFQHHLLQNAKANPKHYSFIRAQAKRYSMSRVKMHKLDWHVVSRFNPKLLKEVSLEPAETQRADLCFSHTALKIGTQPKVCVPNLEEGLKPFPIPMEEEPINRRFPKLKRHPVQGCISHERVSQDPNVHRLVSKFPVDIVLSSSGLKCLLNNHGPQYEHLWNIPFFVVDNPGGGKVVYVDKPLGRHPMSHTELNLLYHKYALRACLSSQRQKKGGHQLPRPVIQVPKTLAVNDDDLFDMFSTHDIETFGTGLSGAGSKPNMSRPANPGPYPKPDLCSQNVGQIVSSNGQDLKQNINPTAAKTSASVSKNVKEKLPSPIKNLVKASFPCDNKQLEVASPPAQTEVPNKVTELDLHDGSNADMSNDERNVDGECRTSQSATTRALRNQGTPNLDQPLEDNLATKEAKSSKRTTRSLNSSTPQKEKIISSKDESAETSQIMKEANDRITPSSDDVRRSKEVNSGLNKGTVEAKLSSKCSEASESLVLDIDESLSSPIKSQDESAEVTISSRTTRSSGIVDLQSPTVTSGGEKGTNLSTRITRSSSGKKASQEHIKQSKIEGASMDVSSGRRLRSSKMSLDGPEKNEAMAADEKVSVDHVNSGNVNKDTTTLERINTKSSGNDSSDCANSETKKRSLRKRQSSNSTHESCSPKILTKDPLETTSEERKDDSTRGPQSASEEDTNLPEDGSSVQCVQVSDQLTITIPPQDDITECLVSPKSLDSQTSVSKVKAVLNSPVKMPNSSVKSVPTSHVKATTSPPVHPRSHKAPRDIRDSTCPKLATQPVPSLQFSPGQDKFDENEKLLFNPLESILGPSSDRGLKQSEDPHEYFPPAENNSSLMYNLWSLGNLRVLIRCHCHGVLRTTDRTQPVYMTPKLEYQSHHALEHVTLGEATCSWAACYIRPNTRLLRARINPFNSEILRLEEQEPSQILVSNPGLQPQKSFTMMNQVLSQLAELECGRYLLHHSPGSPTCAVYKTTKGKKHAWPPEALQAMWKRTPNPVPWIPIDTNILLPQHTRYSRIPGTFIHKDASLRPVNKGKSGGAVKGKNKNKKKKKQQHI